jgi:hypothetical protein
MHPLRPVLVCEVAYDHRQGDRFRHATAFVRWRPDRDAGSCTFDQLEVVTPVELAEVFGSAVPHTGGGVKSGTRPRRRTAQPGPAASPAPARKRGQAGKR